MIWATVTHNHKTVGASARAGSPSAKVAIFASSVVGESIIYPLNWDPIDGGHIAPITSTPSEILNPIDYVHAGGVPLNPLAMYLPDPDIRDATPKAIESTSGSIVGWTDIKSSAPYCGGGRLIGFAIGKADYAGAAITSNAGVKYVGDVTQSAYPGSVLALNNAIRMRMLSPWSVNGGAHGKSEGEIWIDKCTANGGGYFFGRHNYGGEIYTSTPEDLSAGMPGYAVRGYIPGSEGLPGVSIGQYMHGASGVGSGVFWAPYPLTTDASITATEGATAFRVTAYADKSVIIPMTSKGGTVLWQHCDALNDLLKDYPIKHIYISWYLLIRPNDIVF